MYSEHFLRFLVEFSLLYDYNILYLIYKANSLACIYRKNVIRVMVWI